jgi:nucleoid-associated protein YgaU
MVTRETRIALLVGLGMIVAFAVVLSEIKLSAPAPAKAGQAVDEQFVNHSLQRAVGETFADGQGAGGRNRPEGARTARVRREQDAVARRSYTVKPNDTLSKIAVAHYGSGNEDLYRLIYEANRSVLASPSQLRVGQVLVVPDISQQSGQSIRRMQTGLQTQKDSYAVGDKTSG